MVGVFNGIIIVGIVVVLWKPLAYWFYAVIAFAVFVLQSLFAAYVYHVWSNKDDKNKEKDEESES